jgi:hypothetical protein
MDFWILAESKNLTKFRFTKIFVFRENLKFLRKYWYFKHFCEQVHENYRFHKHFRERYIFQTLSCPGCPVQVTYRPTCPVRPVSVVPSQLPGSRCPVLTRLSCLVCPVLAVVLFQLPCPGHIGHCFPDIPVMSWQSCHLRSFQAHLFRHRLGRPVKTVRSQLSFPGCLVPAVLSNWSCPRCPLSTGIAVPSWLPRLSWISCPRYPLNCRG